jgi:hypothetical protein
MEENKESVIGVMEKLAMITDATQSLFPNGKSVIVFELPENDFREVQKNFREIDKDFNKFKIDISGVELIFILENSYDEEKPVEEKPIEEPIVVKKEGLIKRLIKSYLK